MDEYISREAVIKAFKLVAKNPNKDYQRGMQDTIDCLVPEVIADIPSADVQEKRYCRMIPLEPDCRDYTDVFICTNCHQYIHLGFIQKEYSGSYCLECGAEVKDGDTE